MDIEDVLNKSEDFANIDDLLGGNDEEDDKSKEIVKIEENAEDGFDNDCQNHGLTISVPHVRVKGESDDCNANLNMKEEKLNVFSSTILDHILKGNTDLVGAASIPINLATEGITEVSKEDMERIREQIEKREMMEGLKAGLGQKKKTEMKMKSRMDNFSVSSSKAKTLAEKRNKLQDDILKYGVAAIEKFYPRQGRKTSQCRKSNDSRSAFRMKPVPHDMHCEEVDALEILKPYSHAKYIRQPEYPTVVYINRKDGLVPLSSLCKESRTLMSNNVELLRCRNTSMGKPGHYVRDCGRLLAIGGTRNVNNLNIKILRVPAFEKNGNKMPLFEIDTEFSEFAASAIYNNYSKKVDIREIKRRQKAYNLQISEKLSENKTNLDQIVFKLNHEKETFNTDDVSLFDSCMESFKEVRETDKVRKKKRDMIQTREPEQESEDQYKCFNLGQIDYSTKSRECDSRRTADTNDPEELKKDSSNVDYVTGEEPSKTPLEVVNKWGSVSTTVSPADLNLDECPPLRGYHEGSIKSLVNVPVKLNFDGYTGYDNCDVEGCFCKQKEGINSMNKNDDVTEFGTPVAGYLSGSQTPSGSKVRPQKIAKDLQRVKRALKTLGVKIIEFDEHDDCMDCLKDYCKFGCICDSLRTKQIPPSHCGKVECMFSCCCSKEALKYSSCGSRRVNISAAVGARIQEDSQRHMAVEERKFSNTVVVTASKDAVMLGGRGTRRERKVPQRYQNANTLMLDVAGKEYVEKEASSESDIEYDDDDKQVDEYERLRKTECLIPCTVIIPMLSIPRSCSVWCMYHCQYSCPCYKYKHPLDYAPDVQTGASNTAKRSIGNKFTADEIKPSKRRRKSEDKSKIESDSHAGRALKKRLKEDSHEEEALLGIEDIDPDWDIKKFEDEPPKTKKVEHPSTSAKKSFSARTRVIPPSKGNFKTQFPYEPKQCNQASNADIPELIEIVSKAKNDVMCQESNLTNTTEGLEIAEELLVEAASKSSLQYVRWDFFKKQFESSVIDLWFWVRPGRGRNLIFLTRGGEKPYIATAINLRNLQGSTQNLPSFVAECINPRQESDNGKYTVLESNGTVWTVKSLLAIKSGKEFKLSMSCTEDIDKKEEIKKKTEGTKVKDDGSSKISLAETVQKLPVGQSLITVVEGPAQRAMMQVKLPPTLASQYWSLISVGQGQNSIQCPDSTLSLKCAILQQAATLSTATSTTVRIPIPVSDQDPSFGVYAVPGLRTHVFVGPFATEQESTVVEDDDDIVCLEEVKDKVDDDEVKIIEPEQEIDTSKGKTGKEKRKLVHDSKVIGQTPTILDKEAEDDDIDIVGEVLVQTKSQAHDLKAETIQKVKEKPLPYYRLKPSEYGKIVMRQSKEAKDVGKSIEIKYEKNGLNEILRARLLDSGKVILTHPDYTDHDVICPNIVAAKAWIDEHFELSACKSEKMIFEDPKPFSEEPPSARSPPPVLKRIKTPSLPSGKSTSNISLFLQTKEQKDMAVLFYELGHTAFNNFFRKNVTKAQILAKALEEIKSLEEEGKKLEQDKQIHLKRRSKLFEDFTKSLNGLPVSRKKAAVVELKELLKRDKEEIKAAKRQKLTGESKLDNVENIEVPSTAQEKHIHPGQTPYTDITGIKTVRSDGSILRPMNAFMLWSKDRRPAMMAQGLSVSQVSQALSEQWQALSEDDRSQFFKEAEHLKNLHKLQHPEYKYSPKSSKSTSTTQSSLSQASTQRSSTISPTPVSPNQPSDQYEKNHRVELNQSSSYPATHIQVPKPLSQLRSQSIPISKHQSLLLPRTKSSSRPAPGLIPVQSQLNYSAGLSKPKQTHFEVLNIPSRPNIKISSTFTPRVPQPPVTKLRRPSVEEVRLNPQSEVFSSHSVDKGEIDNTLNMQDIPQDAADVLGLAMQSSGLQEQEPFSQQWGHGSHQNKDQTATQQFIIQGNKIKERTLSQTAEQKFIHIGGDKYQLVEQKQRHEQQVVLNPEQAQQVILAQQQGQQLLLEQEQLVMDQETGQQMLLNSGHMFVDEHGRQVILRPDQQMMLQSQEMLQLGDDQLMQLDEQQLMEVPDSGQMVQLEPGQQMVQLEGQDGQRVMVAYQEHGDLVFQAQGEGLNME